MKVGELLKEKIDSFKNYLLKRNVFKKEFNSEENVIRCPICYLIPFISIENSNEQIILNLKCLNNHEIKKPINKLYYESKNLFFVLFV